MSAPILRNALVRLAHGREDLRPHLLPILRDVSESKVAHGPVALTRPDVMLYMIDPDSNKSKFYEMVVVPSGSETPAQKTKRWSGDAWVLCRRWGRLTDVGGVTGRVDSMNDTFASRAEAERAMTALQREKSSKGYEDVSHSREYPIGLGGAGFGWGGQAACAFVPELRQLHSSLEEMENTIDGLQGSVTTLERRKSGIAPRLKQFLGLLARDVGQFRVFLDDQLSECRA